MPELPEAFSPVLPFGRAGLLHKIFSLPAALAPDIRQAVREVGLAATFSPKKTSKTSNLAQRKITIMSR